MEKYKVLVNGVAYEVEIEKQSSSTTSSRVESQSNQEVKRTNVPLTVRSSTPAASNGNPVEQATNVSNASSETVVAPMQGKIVQIPIKEGQAVKKGQVLVVLEAMKMENEIMAPKDGTVQKIYVTVNQAIETNDLIVSLI